MTRSAVAIQHVAFEDLGVLGPLLREQGFEVSYLEAATTADAGWGRARDADLLVVLGGPVGVGESGEYPFLGTELELLRSRIAGERPTLGICLGAQLMAVACGGTVAPGAAAEIGYGPVDLTAAARGSALEALNGAPVLHWHGDVISTPAGLPPLAVTAACANQAFAVGTNVLALQFHLEADVALLEQWLVGHAYEIAARGVSVAQLRQDAQEHGAVLASRAEQVFSRWLAGLAFPD
jgi:GMP synthase (glutamine-hydrolysing)